MRWTSRSVSGVLGCEEASGDRGEKRKLLDEQSRIYTERVRNTNILRMMVNGDTEYIYNKGKEEKRNGEIQYEYTIISKRDLCSTRDEGV